MKLLRSFLLLLLLVVLSLLPVMRLHRASANFGQASPASQHSSAPILKLPGPAEQDLMLGTWSIKSKYPPTDKMPSGDTGKGTEIWRPGPGNNSVIEELEEKSGSGTLRGFAIAWWDEKAKGQRFVWCDNLEPHGCYVSKNVATRQGGRLVYSEDVVENGNTVTRQEIFQDITPASFTQLLLSGPKGGALKPEVTIHATKVAGGESNTK
jgi:hypothetical protein